MVRLFVGSYFGRLLETAPECLIAIQRMETFLLLEDAKLRTKSSSSSSASSSSSSSSEVLVHVSNASFGRGNVVVVENIDLKVSRGELIMIAGPVGCGKSTLLTGVLGETELIEGHCELKASSVAYSPQEAWIMAGTLESNILFGEPFDQNRLDRVIDVCALRTDINQLADGLKTEIGEKGVNLSGGQRARVSLARACYAKTDLVILDDPLSAVDPSVADHIFNKCIQQWLCQDQKAAVILVSHQLQFLPNATRIVLMELGSEIIVNQNSMNSLHHHHDQDYYEQDNEVEDDDINL
jgi:ABC-type multidrug transport system fused ATPase/permease subunit